MADAVEAGMGAAIMPRALIADRPALVELGEPIAVMRMPVWVLMHPDARHIPRVRALFEHVIEALARSPRLVHAP
jgi:DNA-binding transcriptional LysR family regulator